MIINKVYIMKMILPSLIIKIQPKDHKIRNLIQKRYRAMRKRNKSLNIRLTDLERTLIYEVAAKQGLSITDLILKLVKENIKNV